MLYLAWGNHMGEDKGTATWIIRVKPSLDELVQQTVDADTHSTKSEFIRQAVREKLEKMGVAITVPLTS